MHAVPSPNRTQRKVLCRVPSPLSGRKILKQFWKVFACAAHKSFNQWTYRLDRPPGWHFGPERAAAAAEPSSWPVKIACATVLWDGIGFPEMTAACRLAAAAEFDGLRRTTRGRCCEDGSCHSRTGSAKGKSSGREWVRLSVNDLYGLGVIYTWGTCWD